MSRGRSFRTWLVRALVLGAFPAVAAAQQPATNWPAVSARLEPAVFAGSAADLRALRTELTTLLTPSLPDDSRHLIQYSIAFLGSRLVNAPGVPDRESNSLLDDAVDRLRAIVRARPRDAEAHALLGSVYGMQIGRSPAKGILLGPRASSALGTAAKIAPDNPRVLLQQGISAFNTPALFGGGMDQAERLLRRSLAAFAKEPTDRPWPNWGRVDGHAWLGQVLHRKGDRAGARAEYDRGLALAPGSGWIRYVLLPSLERGAKP